MNKYVALLNPVFRVLDGAPGGKARSWDSRGKVIG